MRTVEFNKLKVQNFLSIGNDCVEIDFKSGVHIITGINKDREDRRNGVGKSAIADAVHFAVFGNTIRDIRKEDIINKVNRKNCCVEFEFSTTENNSTQNIRIVRTLQPSKCWLYIDDEDMTRDSIANTNRFIQKKLKTTPDIFQNCVIMTINATTPFLAKNKGEKRKFIESIFNLKIFSDMADILKEELADTRRDSEVQFTRVEGLEENYNTQQKQYDSLLTERSERDKKLKKRQDDIDNQITDLQTKINNITLHNPDEIQKKIQTIDEKIILCEDKITSLTKDVTTRETEKKHKQLSLNKLSTDGDECEYCLRAMDDQDKEIIDNHKICITTEIADIIDSIRDLDLKVDEYSGLKNRLKEAGVKLNNQLKQNEIDRHDKQTAEDSIERLLKWKKETIDETATPTTLKSCKQTLDELFEKLKIAKDEVASIKKKINLLDVVKFVISEEGVRSYIVKKILQLFNSRLAYYLKRMDANCICLFNEYFEEELFDEKGRECSYFNFSGAERKNLDLACLFTFIDIRRFQGDVSYNVTVYDELLDSSLDEKGVEMVIDILHERVTKFNECVMIISHRKESVKAIGEQDDTSGDVIFLEKENGITRRTQYNE